MQEFGYIAFFEGISTCVYVPLCAPSPCSSAALQLCMPCVPCSCSCVPYLLSACPVRFVCICVCVSLLLSQSARTAQFGVCVVCVHDDTGASTRTTARALHAWCVQHNTYYTQTHTHVHACSRHQHGCSSCCMTIHPSIHSDSDSDSNSKSQLGRHVRTVLTHIDCCFACDIDMARYLFVAVLGC